VNCNSIIGAYFACIVSLRHSVPLIFASQFDLMFPVRILSILLTDFVVHCPSRAHEANVCTITDMTVLTGFHSSGQLGRLKRRAVAPPVG